MKFLTIIIIGFLLTILPSCAASKDTIVNTVPVNNKKIKQETWKQGDIVAAFVVCKTEKDIMEIAFADSLGEPEILNKILEKKVSKKCIQFQPPIPFLVIDVLGSYIDYKKIETSILKIKSKWNEQLVGYVIVAGKPAKDKGI